VKRTIAFVFALLLFLTSTAGAQQPQTQLAPISAVNAKYVNGVAPGYWATAGGGLTLNLSAGTAFCSGTIEPYAAGTLSMTASTTNYVYLNTSAGCVPAVKTTAFTSSDIPVATVVAGPSAIASITDDRTIFQQGSSSGGGVPSVNGITSAVTISGSGVSTAGSTITISGSGAAVDILSDQKATGTPFYTKAEYASWTSGTPVTLLSRTGAGYVTNIWLATPGSCTNSGNDSTTDVVLITANGDSSPNISIPCSEFFNSEALGSTPFASSLFGSNGVGHGVWTHLPIPYSNGITITYTPSASGIGYFEVEGQSGVADSWPGTEKLWATALYVEPQSLYPGLGVGFSAYAQENIVNYAGTNPGRFVGLFMFYNQGSTGGFTPLEGNIRIFTDVFNSTWAASTAFSLGQTIMDQNGNLQTVTTAGSTGTSEPTSFSGITGVTTSDGSVVWTATAGQPANIWRPSASYALAGMSVLDPAGNVWTVTTTGTTGSTEPSAASSGTVSDGSVVWTASPASSYIRATYQSSGTEDFFGWSGYFSNMGAPISSGELGVSVGLTGTHVAAYRYFLRNPFRFNHSIAIYREMGDSSEATFSGSEECYQVAYWYTQDTN
jgi:hypothetical protein